MTWEDERLRVIAVAGVSFRPEAVADGSFDPGARLALVPEPDNEHDPNAVGIWNEARTLQAGYVPREVAGELDGSEVAVSLWRFGEGLRVLIVPAGSWVGRPRTRGVYLDPARAGVRWLLDPHSVRLGTLAREATDRVPDAPCDARALAADAGRLRELLRERHFGVATGRVPAPDDVVDRWERRLLDGPTTWGEAVGQLQFDLRRALVDEHVRLLGAPRWADGRDELDEEGPAVEERELDGVLLLRIRRLMGGPEDEAAIARWVAGADRHFSHDRIVVDLRGNSGGNDGHTLAWAGRRIKALPGFARDEGWVVRGVPLGAWNTAAWREARDGKDAVPRVLLEGRHEPRPGDRLEIAGDEGSLPAGDCYWGGRMIVLTDRRTRSSGESSAWLLRQGLTATIAGERSTGMIEYGNIVPYVLERSALVIQLPTKRNDFGLSVEGVGFPVDVELDAQIAVEDVVAQFDAIARR